jgi:hypothetical protein
MLQHRGTVALCGVAISRLRALNFVTAHLPFLENALRVSQAQHPLQYGELECVPLGTIQLTPAEEEKLSSTAANTVAEGQLALKQAVNTAVYQKVLADLDGFEGPKKAYFLSGADSAAAAFLGCAHGIGHGGVLHSEAFRIAMQFRMLAPQLDANGDPAGRCFGCGVSKVRSLGRQGEMRPIFEERWSHAAACPGGASGALFIRRHNRIAFELRAALQSAALGAAAEMEKSVLLPPVAGEVAQRASPPIDILFHNGNGAEIFIDIAVADPGCPSYLLKGSDKRAEAAAAAREEEKKRLFGIKFRGLEEAKFVPFVLESTGRLGPAAKKFLLSLALPPTRLRRLVERLSLACAGHLGRLVQRAQGLCGA